VPSNICMGEKVVVRTLIFRFRGEKRITHVILLIVEPVEWGFGAVGAVGGSS